MQNLFLLPALEWKADLLGPHFFLPLTCCVTLGKRSHTAVSLSCCLQNGNNKGRRLLLAPHPQQTHHQKTRSDLPSGPSKTWVSKECSHTGSTLGEVETADRNRRAFFLLLTITFTQHSWVKLHFWFANSLGRPRTLTKQYADVNKELEKKHCVSQQTLMPWHQY